MFRRRFLLRSTPKKSVDLLKRNIAPITYSKLSNGFNVVSEYHKGLEFSTIGVWIDAGSRFETRKNNGVAHFLEHMNFKGTKKFSKQAIENTFERSGGHFNAYTSRDRTSYYMKCFNQDVDRVMELLADILRFGKYLAKDVNSERSTILSEMREVESLVDEVIMDNLHLVAYDASHCGLPLTILGPGENIAVHINREMILDYIQTHYTGPRMTLVCSGGLDHSEVEKLAQTYYGDMPSENNRPVLNAKYVGGEAHLFNAQMSSAHLAWAFPLCGAKHEDTVVFQLIQTLFGTYRRELHDLHIHQGFHRQQLFNPELETSMPFYTPYEETALLGFYFVTVPNSVDRSSMSSIFEGTFEKMASLCEHRLDPQLLEDAKATFKAANLLMCDSTTNNAEDIGRQMIHFGRRVPVQELFESIDAVTPDRVMDVMNKYFANCTPSISCIGHPGMMPQYDGLLHLASRCFPALDTGYAGRGVCPRCQCIVEGFTSSAATAYGSTRPPSSSRYREPSTSTEGSRNRMRNALQPILPPESMLPTESIVEMSHHFEDQGDGAPSSDQELLKCTVGELKSFAQRNFPTSTDECLDEFVTACLNVGTNHRDLFLISRLFRGISKRRCPTGSGYEDIINGFHVMCSEAENKSIAQRMEEEEKVWKAFQEECVLDKKWIPPFTDTGNAVTRSTSEDVLYWIHASSFHKAMRRAAAAAAAELIAADGGAAAAVISGGILFAAHSNAAVPSQAILFLGWVLNEKGCTGIPPVVLEDMNKYLSDHPHIEGFVQCLRASCSKGFKFVSSGFSGYDVPPEIQIYLSVTTLRDERRHSAEWCTELLQDCWLTNRRMDVSSSAFFIGLKQCHDLRTSYDFSSLRNPFSANILYLAGRLPLRSKVPAMISSIRALETYRGGICSHGEPIHYDARLLTLAPCWKEGCTRRNITIAPATARPPPAATTAEFFDAEDWLVEEREISFTPQWALRRCVAALHAVNAKTPAAAAASKSKSLLPMVSAESKVFDTFLSTYTPSLAPPTAPMQKDELLTLAKLLHAAMYSSFPFQVAETVSVFRELDTAIVASCGDASELCVKLQHLLDTQSKDDVVPTLSMFFAKEDKKDKPSMSQLANFLGLPLSDLDDVPNQPFIVAQTFARLHSSSVHFLKLKQEETREILTQLQRRKKVIQTRFPGSIQFALLELVERKIQRKLQLLAEDESQESLQIAQIESPPRGQASLALTLQKEKELVKQVGEYVGALQLHRLVSYLKKIGVSKIRCVDSLFLSPTEGSPTSRSAQKPPSVTHDVHSEIRLFYYLLSETKLGYTEENISSWARRLTVAGIQCLACSTFFSAFKKCTFTFAQESTWHVPGVHFSCEKIVREGKLPEFSEFCRATQELSTKLKIDVCLCGLDTLGILHTGFCIDELLHNLQRGKGETASATAAVPAATDTVLENNEWRRCSRCGNAIPKGPRGPAWPKDILYSPQRNATDISDFIDSTSTFLTNFRTLEYVAGKIATKRKTIEKAA